MFFDRFTKLFPPGTDFSKLAFVAASIVIVTGLSFLFGVHSTETNNVLYRTARNVIDDSKLVLRELTTMSRMRPEHFLERASYKGDGVTLNKAHDKEEQYLLLSGFIKDTNEIRLIRRDGTIIHRWPVEFSKLVANPEFCRNPPKTDWNAIPHGTIAQPDGSVIFSFESCALVKLDRCGNIEWSQTSAATHHSPNFTEDGGIIIGGGVHVAEGSEEVPWPFKPPYWKDVVYKFDRDGHVLYRHSIQKLLLKNGFVPLLTADGEHETDMDGDFHLNDVEELSSKLAPGFPMFKAGDLLLSLRDYNMILVVDREFEKVKWWKIGPWLRQHDPDFEPGGKITVLDNNDDGSARGTIHGGSRIIEVDPATNETRILYGGRPGQHMYTAERGTHQMLPGGDILVTEAQAGRVFETDAEGHILWEFVNRYDKHEIAWMHDAVIYPASYFTAKDWNCPGDALVSSAKN